MQRKDEFLILGFTGAFSSGCTTAAMFFKEKLDKVRNEFLAKKEEINAAIGNLYNDSSPDLREDIENPQKQVLKLVRKRQILNALEDLEAVDFFYVSMTDMMHSLLLENLVCNGIQTSSAPSVYSGLIDFVISWCNQQEINSDYLSGIRAALENRDTKDDNKTLFFDYIEKLNDFRMNLNQRFSANPYQLFDIMQRIGNNLRKCGKPFADDENFSSDSNLDILSRRAGTVLKFHRLLRKTEASSDLRTYYLVECLRNPSEIDYFRRRFYEFYLFSVYSDEHLRIKRAEQKYGLTENDCIKIDTIDQGGDYVINQYSQNIKRCVYLADISVTNRKLPYDLYQELLRYYALIKNPGCIKPTHMERNMNLAYSVSLNSTCICRQVGAVIINKSYIVGAGWNDTGGGRLGCIYRQRGDVLKTDNQSFPIASERDYKLFREVILDKDTNLDHSFCYKDEMGKFKRKQSINKDTLDQDCVDAVAGIETRSLQHCRALHAEENAILQTSKIGGTGLQGATLYTTTFPCELCAKKILQVGIRRIVYCEPYPRSVSMDVFFKESSIKDFEALPFEGVKSPSFFRLFKPVMDIKDIQQLELLRFQSKPNYA